MANISMGFRIKASNHTFLLVALLPVLNFIHPNTKIKGVLEARLFHSCVNLVMQPLKKAAMLGVMMSDPCGFSCHCFMPIASCIVDTPESALIACVGGQTSSVTLASHPQFCAPFCHCPRLAKYTLRAIAKVEESVHPWKLLDYEKEVR